MVEDNHPTEDRWERETLRQIALEVVKEQRRSRRWNIFFRLALLVYLTALLLAAGSCEMGGSVTGRHTAVVSVSGLIMEDSPASAELIIEGLQNAFEAENVAGVILKINSPGGSPVQAGIVNDEIRRLRALHPDTPIYAVVTDLCTSGGYYMAVAADRIFVNKASLVGSIGVLMDGFGFTGTMDKLGVERRLYTAGDSKGFLDPFSPEQPRDVAHVNDLLDQIHAQFIQVVKEGRGERLAAETPGLFSGLVWTGDQSVKLGLADDFGDVHGVARDVIGAEEVVDYTPRLDLFSRFADRLGASAARQLRTYAQGLGSW